MLANGPRYYISDADGIRGEQLLYNGSSTPHYNNNHKSIGDATSRCIRRWMGEEGLVLRVSKFEFSVQGLLWVCESIKGCVKH